MFGKIKVKLPFFISNEETKSKEAKREEKVVNILLVDLENYVFNTLKLLIDLWDTDFKTLREVLRQSPKEFPLQAGSPFEALGIEVVKFYVEQLTGTVLDLMGVVGKELKEVSGYGYISVAFFTAKKNNAPIFEKVRKRLIERLKEESKDTIIRFYYGSIQKENDDYILEGLISYIFDEKKKAELIDVNNLPPEQKKEWARFITLSPRVVVITNDKRLKDRLKEKYPTKLNKDLLLWGVELNEELRNKIEDLKASFQRKRLEIVY